MSDPPVGRAQRLLLEELGVDVKNAGLAKHLEGCLKGYEESGGSGAAVYFALEALWGISIHWQAREDSDDLEESQRESDGSLDGEAEIPVPWIWVAALAGAWNRYKDGDLSLAKAFGLEATGQGKDPIGKKLNQEAEGRAMAHLVWRRVQAAEESGEKKTILDAQMDVAEELEVGHSTVERSWNLHHKFAKGTEK